MPEPVLQIEPTEIHEVKQPAGSIARGKNSVVVGESKTTASAGDDRYKTEFVKVYQDAGVIGVSMLTLLVLCIVMGWFSMRVLKMYAGMLESRDKTEALKLEYFDKLTNAVTTLSVDTHSLKEQLTADHDAQCKDIAANGAAIKTLAGDLNRYLFRRLEEPK